MIRTEYPISSVNLDRFMVRSFQGPGLYPQMDETTGVRSGALQGRTRRIAIVAIARKLLIALWRYVETGLIPAGITLRVVPQAGV